MLWHFENWRRDLLEGTSGYEYVEGMSQLWLRPSSDKVCVSLNAYFFSTTSCCQCPQDCWWKVNDSSTLLMRLLVGVEVNCFITFSFQSLVWSPLPRFRVLYLTCMVHHSFFVSVLSLPRILGRIDLVHRFGGSFQGSVIKA